jgi:hypothetical protein
MRRGPTRAGDFRRIISRAVTKQPCGSVVGRLLDTFDEDASGVSVRQHFATDFEVRITSCKLVGECPLPSLAFQHIRRRAGQAPLQT